MWIRYTQYENVCGYSICSMRMYMDMICTDKNVCGYGLHSMRMYMGMVCTEQYQNVYGYGVHSMRFYVGKVCTVLVCIWVGKL